MHQANTYDNTEQQSVETSNSCRASQEHEAEWSEQNGSKAAKAQHFAPGLDRSLCCKFAS